MVFFLPKESIVCTRLFQEEGIFASVSIRAFPLYLIPFDHDLLSLELEGPFRVRPQSSETSARWISGLSQSIIQTSLLWKS